MNKPYFSIIIPTFNSAETLTKLLKSILLSTFKNFEIIVIDDSSNDKTTEIIRKYPVRYEKLKKRSGPSVARNAGAKLAKGDILFFLDADALIFKNTISEMVRGFKNNPKVHACAGRVSWKEPANPNLFTRWKALRDFAYWSVERENKYITTVGGMISAYKKKAFWDAGGFDSKFQDTNNEDFEFAYRFSKKYEVFFNPNLKVMHHYGDFWGTTKKYFRRAYHWSELFAKNKAFYNEGATPKESIIGFLALISLVSFVLGFYNIVFLWVGIGLFLLRLFLSRKFIILAFKEDGFWFMIYSILVGFWMHLIIYAGAFCWVATRPVIWIKSSKTI